MKILGIAQRGTETGLTRIRDLVHSDDLEFVYVENFKKHHWESRISEYEPFDGILSQCITHIPFEFRQRTVLFGLGSTNRRVLNKENIRKTIIEHPLKGYWVNNNTISKKLSEVGIDTKVMYRANDVYIPKSCPPGADNKFIIWYANSWNGCLQRHKPLAKDVISRLGEFGVKVFILPHQTGWVQEPHVCSLGKVDVRQIIPMVHGMVRFGDLGDFGRINYDVVAQGRWALNYNVDEPWMESVNPNHNVEDIVAQIMNLIQNDSEQNRVDRWLYAKKYFSKQAMSKTWTEALYYTFYG